MKPPCDYRAYAEHCRELAAAMSRDEHRAQLLRMADNWERMAREAERRSAAESEAG